MTYVDDLVTFTGKYQGDQAALAARTGTRNGHEWCHLYADTEEELHRFAVEAIGMERRWAQVSRSGIPHYDLTPRRRGYAVAQGARQITRREAFELRQRIRPRRAEGGP